MILLFSGNGNTAMAAQHLSSALGGETIYVLTAEDLRKPDKFRLKLNPAEKRIIWAFPIYSWAVPPVISRLIERMPDPDNRLGSLRHYMLCTYGDDAGRADVMWETLLKHRGWPATGAFGVQMPNTYVCLPGFDIDTTEAAARKVVAMPRTINTIAQAIRADVPTAPILNPGAMPGFKTRVIYPVFRRILMSPRAFRADRRRCTGCGRCARSCPMANITIDTADGLPSWGDACAFCLRCYHVCPHHAISNGPFTASKGQYRAPNIPK